MTFFVVVFMIYAFFTYKTVQIQETILNLMNYRIARNLARKGFILKKGRRFIGEDQEKVYNFFTISDIIKFIPFINIAYTALFSSLIVRKTTKKEYQDSDKRYLSDKEKYKIVNATTIDDLVEAVDLVRLKDIKEENENLFSTSQILSGDIHLRGKLPDLSYTLLEIKKMASKLNKPFTIGKVEDYYLAFIGDNIENPINVYPVDRLFIPVDEVEDNCRFRVFLLNLEDITEEEKNQLVEMVKHDRNTVPSVAESGNVPPVIEKERKLELTHTKR